MTNPTPLSPAAQAVWDAAWNLSPVNCESHEDCRRQQIAASLRAAAQHLYHDWSAFNCIDALCEIADELEGQDQ
jgi:hypothetical protein